MFERKAFADNVGSDYILVSLDFPEGEEAKAKVPHPQRNEELQAKYGIKAYPTVLLMTPQGEVFGQTGYTGDTPEDYLKTVRTLRREGKISLKEVKAILEAYDKAEDKLGITRQAVALLMKKKDSIVARPLARIVREGLELDPEDQHGLRIPSLMALMLSSNADAAELEMAAVADAKNEHGLLEYVVAGALDQLNGEEELSGFLLEAEALHQTGKVHNAELVSFLWLNSAYFCHKFLDRPEDAVLWAKRAQDVGGLEEQYQELLEEILGEQDSA